MIHCPSEGDCIINCLEGDSTCYQSTIFCQDDNTDDLIIQCESDTDDTICELMQVSCASGNDTCTCKENLTCYGNRCPPEFSSSPTVLSLCVLIL